MENNNNNDKKPYGEKRTIAIKQKFGTYEVRLEI